MTGHDKPALRRRSPPLHRRTTAPARPDLLSPPMPTVEFWFDFASTYSHVAAFRLPALAAAASVTVVPRPFLLGPLFTAQLGIRDSPFNVRPERGRYMWRDIERLSARHGVPFRRPSAFPRHSVLAARIGCAGEGQPWLPEFVRGVFAANFAEDRDIADRAVLRSLLEPLGAGAMAALDQAETPEVKLKLRANTEEATRLGLFGAPNFLVEGEHFFGQDRIADALDWSNGRKVG